MDDIKIKTRVTFFLYGTSRPSVLVFQFTNRYGGTDSLIDIHFCGNHLDKKRIFVGIHFHNL